LPGGERLTAKCIKRSFLKCIKSGGHIRLEWPYNRPFGNFNGIENTFKTCYCRNKFERRGSMINKGMQLAKENRAISQQKMEMG
jgi:hypothetical protein